jgi:uncharacterized protein (DUF2141 family)
MKKLQSVLGMVTLGSILGTALSSPLPAQAADVTVQINDISEPGGMIHWVLFDSAQAFDDGGIPVMAARSRVASDSLSVTVYDLPTGRYAVRLFHDSNGNGEMDRNIIGIPKEGYGFSGDAGGRGPASFEDAAVAVEGDTTITVRVR